MTIRRDESALDASAASLNGLSSRISQLGANLDSALRPARRGDVPELAEIDALYGAARGRISQSAATLSLHARDLRLYAARSRAIEALNMMLLSGVSPVAGAGPGRRLGGFRWGDLRRFLDPAQATTEGALGGAKDLLLEKEALKYAGWAHLLGRPLLAYGIATSMQALLDPKSDAIKRFLGAANLTGTGVTLTAGLNTLLHNAGARGLLAAGGRGAAVLAGASQLVLPVLVGAGVGDAIGRNRYAEMVRLEAMGLDPVKVARDDLAKALAQNGALPVGPGTHKVVVAQYDLVTAELATNKWIGKHVFGAVEEGPNDYLANHKATAVIAGVRAEFPGSRIVQNDNGTFTIVLPGIAGLPSHQVTYDNKTGRATSR